MYAPDNVQRVCKIYSQTYMQQIQLVIPNLNTFSVKYYNMPKSCNFNMYMIVQYIAKNIYTLKYAKKCFRVDETYTFTAYRKKSIILRLTLLIL